jgi:predicted RNase H-like nuclease (RuvC/YqgF family)
MSEEIESLLELLQNDKNIRIFDIQRLLEEALCNVKEMEQEIKELKDLISNKDDIIEHLDYTINELKNKSDRKVLSTYFS